MKSFQLDSQLHKDCITLGELEHCLLLLMNNALLPWFILVPKTDKTELYELANDVQAGVWAEVNAVSKFVKNEFAIDKLNVAAIGNVVKQLHIHVIGRKYNDFCWPGVVWGRTEKTPYNKQTIDHIMATVDNSFPIKIKLMKKS
jgi:diadenosine tetraphosphate (Ap4A) HIT family hydrolase